MAAPTITNVINASGTGRSGATPTDCPLHTGTYVTVVGTGFEDDTGTDPITSITIDTPTPITITDYIVDSSSSLRIRIPTLADGTLDSITVTNGTGSANTGGLGDILFTVETYRGEFQVIVQSHSGTFTTESLEAKGSFIVDPTSHSGVFTTESLEAKGRFQVTVLSHQGRFSSEELLAKGGFQVGVASNVGTFTTVSAGLTYLGDISFSINSDCTVLTITDTTDYVANAEVRSNFSLSLNVVNLKTGLSVTAIPDNIDPLLVTSWAISVAKDTIYSVKLIDSGTTIRDLDHYILMCNADDRRNSIEQQYLQTHDCADCVSIFDEYLMITALHDAIVANFRYGKYALALSLLEDIENEYQDYIDEGKLEYT